MRVPSLLCRGHPLYLRLAYTSVRADLAGTHTHTHPAFPRPPAEGAKPRLAAARDGAARGPAAPAHLQVLHGDLQVGQVKVRHAAAAERLGGPVAEGEDVGERVAAQPLLRGERGQRPPVAVVQHETRHARRLLRRRRRRDGPAGRQQQQHHRRRAQEQHPGHLTPATDCRAPQAPTPSSPAPRGEGRAPPLSANRNNPAHPPSPMRARRGRPCEWEISLSAVSQWTHDVRSLQPMRTAGRRGRSPQRSPLVNISDSSTSPSGGEGKGAEPLVAQQPMKDLFRTLCQSCFAGGRQERLAPARDV